MNKGRQVAWQTRNRNKVARMGEFSDDDGELVSVWKKGDMKRRRPEEKWGGPEYPFGGVLS